MRRPCFGKFNILKAPYRWLCLVCGDILAGYRLTRETKQERKESRETEQERFLRGDQEQQERFRQEARVESRRAREGYIPPTQLPCYGSYDDSDACGYCSDKNGCFQIKHYPTSSSFATEPTDSSAVDTGATRAEGGITVNNKDFETRKAKAKDLEVTAVGTDFLVKSSTRQGGYMVTVKKEGGYHCACMDFATHRGDQDWKCKHIIAVETYLEKRGSTNSDSRYDLLDLNE